MSNDRIDYGKIIKSLRNKYHMTQSELGAKISVGKTAISNYETGYSVPSAHVLEDIANVFEMSLIDFLSYGFDEGVGSLSLPRLNQPVNDRVIPYIKEANINENTLSAKNYMDTYLTLPSFMLSTEDDYVCIKMPDDSMTGDNIQKNDYIIVRKNSNTENRKIVMAIYRPTGAYMIRRCIRDGRIIALVPSSASSKYSIIRSDERDDDILIIGYVEKIINSAK